MPPLRTTSAGCSAGCASSSMGGPRPKRLRILSAGEMPRLSEGGTALIRAWIEQAPEPKLVVIDVLAKVRDPRRKDQGLYDSDYAAMEELKKIADEYGIAIVVIHHLRKMDADDPLDQVSGTTGLSGSADTVLVLNRTSSGTTTFTAAAATSKTSRRRSSSTRGPARGRCSGRPAAFDTRVSGRPFLLRCEKRGADVAGGRRGNDRHEGRRTPASCWQGRLRMASSCGSAVEARVRTC